MSVETVKIKINGQPVEAKPHQTILEVVQEQGLDSIPTLCHSPELDPYASCFLCVVEVKGRPNLVPACATRVAPDMEITTSNERIRASRQTALELLLSNHYADCVSSCMDGCPASVDAQGYIALSAMGLPREAVDLIREANPLPAVCGRVCVRKCEIVCRREDVDRSVGINAIKRFVTDAPGIYDEVPPCAPATGKSIGIVGAGPAGLTTAWFLGLAGHKPILYEANSRSGGMLRYGIPEYRLPDEVMDAETDYICRAGAEIKYNTRVGVDVQLDQLMEQHDAVFLGAGAWTGKPMGLKGEFETEGIVDGVSFLFEMAEERRRLSGVIVVVGGGNTAMDVARTAWRLGADKVIVLYRRTRAEMPADELEIEDCIEEGIEIMELAAPVGIIDEQGKLKGLSCIRMKLGEPDDSGRRRPVPLEGSEFELSCQLAVAAIGQSPVLEGLERAMGQELGISRWNTIDVDLNTMCTNIEGVFAGGDAADDGPTVVIDAIRDGQRAARAINAYFKGEELPGRPFAVRKEFWSKPGQAELGEVQESPRHEVNQIEVEERRDSFMEVASGFDWEDNIHETARCLACGCVRFADCDLRLYAEEYGVDMDHFKGYVRKHKVDDRHPYIIYDPNKCILCARCVRTCEQVLPLAALGLVGRGFRTEMRPALNDPLVETSCVSCGNCIDACPTGALETKLPFPGRASLATSDAVSTCGFCSLGCDINVKSFSDGRYYLEAAGEPGSYLCRYGRYGYELFIKQNRILAALTREEHARKVVPLTDALAQTVAGLREIAEQHGPEQVAVFVSPDLTNEELYLAARIAREGIGTNNIASLSLLGTGKETNVLDASLGFTASTSDLSCLNDADLIICNNTSMEADHLILAVDLISAVKRGAKMIVTNSTLDLSDKLLSELVMDPMRGRSALLWNGVIQLLIEDGYLPAAKIEQMTGGGEFLRGREFSLEQVIDQTGVDEEQIRQAAASVREARKVVFVHSSDRLQDQAPYDMRTLANFVLLLRAVGVEAELLLPRNNSNSAGLTISGADPLFLPGRQAANGLPGAATSAELRDLLAEGTIRGALIIGEDPLGWNRTSGWFQNLQFLAAMDWTDTETTHYADVVLPGSTYLETAGTRCNYLGEVERFEQVITPPPQVSGREVLSRLAEGFGLTGAAEAVDSLIELLQPELGRAATYYLNSGQTRERLVDQESLVPVGASVKTLPLQPPLTHTERYKRETREIGTAHYRVQQ